MRYTCLALGFAVLLPLGNSMAAQNLINIDVQKHVTEDANLEDLGTPSNPTPGTNPWIGSAPDGVPSLIDFDGTDPVDLRDDAWNYVSMLDYDANNSLGGFGGIPASLNDISGASSNITFEFTTPRVDLEGGERPDSLPGGFGFEADDIVRDEIHNISDILGGTGLTLDWKLGGLDASDSTTYDVYVISALIYGGSWAEIGLTHSGATVAEIKGLSDPDNGGNSITYIDAPIALGGQYQEFLGVTANASGELTGFVREWEDGGGQVYLSAIQIVEHTVTVAQPGDYNGDGIVNAADYTVWLDNLGATDESSLNGNGDGLNGVDAADYALWVSNFGNGSSTSTSTAIPEPSALLLMVCGLGLLRNNRR